MKSDSSFDRTGFAGDAGSSNFETQRWGALIIAPGVRRLAASWLLLALCALAFSTLCAVLLVVARTPWLSTLTASGELFGRALVLHVSLAVVVWFLACAAAFWTLVSGAAASPWRWVPWGVAVTGLVALVMSLFFGAAQPVLANYVPVLDHPVFLVGLMLFGAGVTFSGAMSVQGVMRQLKGGPAWHLGAALSMLAALTALGAWVVAVATAGLPSTAARFEVLAWGPGHVLQFVHVILLMSVWSLLGEQVLEREVMPAHWLRRLLWLAAVPLLAVPLIYVNYPTNSYEFRRAFTLLMSLGAWPAPAALAIHLLLQLKRSGPIAWKTPLASALALSAALFLLGCVLGTMIEGDSIMVPAHYHGTVGAVTLAYMAFGYRLLQGFGVPSVVGIGPHRQLLLYGCGLIVLALALAWSGSMGVPRKTLHADIMVQYPAYFVAMGLAGLGGLLAIIGAGLFVANVLLSVNRSGVGATLGRKRRDIRVKALILTLLLTSAVGIALIYWTPDHGSAVSIKSPDPRRNLGDHVAQKRVEEVKRRFANGVSLLGTKQFDAAASELHRVLELEPQMPEAHVNMGFAMIGAGRHALARDFFSSAIELKTNQLNAYYGLAVALEGLGDIAGALGAMRSYVHLSKADDAYLMKANAAIWEWEDELRKAPAGSGIKPDRKP